MIKKTGLFMLSLILSLSLAACGAKTVDEKAFSDDVLKNVKFAVELNKIDSGMFSTLYGVDLPKDGEAQVYCGSAAAADQFLIFKVENSSEIDGIKTSVEELRDNLAATYKTYNTAELDKINNAVIRTSDSLVIMIITDDYDNAAKIADKYF